MEPKLGCARRVPRMCWGKERFGRLFARRDHERVCLLVRAFPSQDRGAVSAQSSLIEAGV